MTFGAAEAYCSQPSAPSCATRYGSFDDTDDFDRCKRQLTSYKDEVESFMSCKQREMDEARREAERAVSDYNDAVQSFNRRARG
jgi:hypothetical protein